MKKITKVALSTALAVGLGIGGISLAGCSDNTDLDIRVQGDYIQWTKDGENWENLISVDDLKGQDADKWTIGDDGFWYFNGDKTDYVAIGQDADKWTIGDDGFWYFNDEKTDYVAEGKDGNGIVSVEIDQDKSDETKTTYVITFDNGKTFTFEVANGYVAPAPVSKAKIEILEDFKKEYIIGEDLDVTGGILTYTNEIGKESYVAITEEMVSGFSSKTTGERYLVITYEGETILYKYTVNNPVFAQIGVPYYTTIPAEQAGTGDAHYVLIFNEDETISAWTSSVLPTVNNYTEILKEGSTVASQSEPLLYTKEIVDSSYVLTLLGTSEGHEIKIEITDEDSITMRQTLNSETLTMNFSPVSNQDDGLYDKYYVAKKYDASWEWSIMQIQKNGKILQFFTNEKPTLDNIEEIKENAIIATQVDDLTSMSVVDGKINFAVTGLEFIVNDDGTILASGYEAALFTELGQEVIEATEVLYGVPYYVSAEATGAEADIMHSVFIFKKGGAVEMWTTSVLPTINNAKELFSEETESTTQAYMTDLCEKTIIDGKYVISFTMYIQEIPVKTTVTVEDENTISVEQIIQTVDQTYAVTLEAAGNEDEGLEYGEYYVSSNQGQFVALKINADGTALLAPLDSQPTVENVEQLIEDASTPVTTADYDSYISDGVLTIKISDVTLTFTQEDGLVWNNSSGDQFTFTKLVLSQADYTFAQIGVPYYVAIDMGTETNYSTVIFNEDETISMWTTTVLPTLNNASELFKEGTTEATLVDTVSDYVVEVIDEKLVISFEMTVNAGNDAVTTTITIEDENTINVEQIIQATDDPYTVTLKAAGSEAENLYNKYYVAKKGHGWSILQVQNDGRVLSFIAGEEPTFDNIEQLKELALGASQGGYMEMTAMSVVDGKLTFAVADLNFVVNEDGTIIASGADAVLFTELGQEIIEVPAVQYGVPYYVSIETTSVEADIMHSVFIFKEDGKIEMWTTPVLPTLNNKDELFKEQTSSTMLADVAEKYEKTVIDGKCVYTFDMNVGQSPIATTVVIEDENTITVEQIIQATDDPYTVTLKAAESEDEGLEYGEYYVSSNQGQFAVLKINTDGTALLAPLDSQPTVENVEQLIEDASTPATTAGYDSYISDGVLTIKISDVTLTFNQEDGLVWNNNSGDQFTFTKLVLSQADYTFAQIGVPYYVAIDMGTETNYSTFIFNEDETISAWTTTVLPTLNNASELFKEGTTAATLVDTVSDYVVEVIDEKLVISFEMTVNAGNDAVTTTITIEDENTISVEQIIQATDDPYTVTLKAAGNEDAKVEYGAYYYTVDPNNAEEGNEWYIVYQFTKDGFVNLASSEREIPTKDNLDDIIGNGEVYPEGPISQYAYNSYMEGEDFVMNIGHFVFHIDKEGNVQNVIPLGEGEDPLIYDMIKIV